MTTGTNTTLLSKLVTKAILPSPACEHARKVYHDIKALAVLGLYVRPRVTYFPPSEELESGYEVTELSTAKIQGFNDILASEWVEQYHYALRAVLSNIEAMGSLEEKHYTILKSKFKWLKKNETVVLGLPSFYGIITEYSLSFAELSLLIVSQVHGLETPSKVGAIPPRFAVIGSDGIITILEIAKNKHKTLLKLKPN